MRISSAAYTFAKSRRRDLLMVSTVVLFPVMLLQFGLNIMILRSARTSEIVASAVPQILVLLLTAALLAGGVRLVMAALLPFVQALQTGEEITADDALKALPRSLRSLPPKGEGVDYPSPVSLYGTLVLGYVVVVALTVLVTGNLLTIGMAFLEMTGLLAVGVLLTPPVAVTLLMLRLGLINPSEEEAAPAESSAPASSSGPSTSVAPPGAGPAPDAAPDAAPAPPSGDRGSVPPPS